MNTLVLLLLISLPTPHTAKIEGWGEQDRGWDGSQGKDRWVGGGGKGKVFNNDEEVVYWCCTRSLWKEEFISEILVWVQQWYDSNQLTILIVEKIPMDEEHEVPIIPEIPEEQVSSEKGYYHGVYGILHVNNEDGVDSK